jgi:hypothetical protein
VDIETRYFSHWNKLILFIETSCCFSLKQVTDGCRKWLLLLIERGHFWQCNGLLIVTEQVTAPRRNGILMVTETVYIFLLKQVIDGIWNRLLLLSETGYLRSQPYYCFPLKQTTDGHWKKLLLLNVTGYIWLLKQVTDGHWNRLLFLIETGYWWSLK